MIGYYLFSLLIATTSVYIVNGELATSLMFYPDQSEGLLVKYASIIQLNCSIKIEEINSETNSSTSVLIRITDELDKVYNSSEVVLSNRFQSVFNAWISYGVKHEYDHPMKTFYCNAKINENSYQKFVNIVYENLPSIPSNISTLYKEGQLILYTNSMPNSFVRKLTGTTYLIKQLGSNCLQNFKHSFEPVPCDVSKKIANIHGEGLLCNIKTTSKMTRSECSSYHVMLKVENQFGDIKKKFTILKSDAPSVGIKKVYPSDTSMLIMLETNVANTGVFHSQYKIRYWSNTQRLKTFVAVQTGLNAITIHKLTPNLCYFVSIQLTLFLQNSWHLSSNWTDKKYLCTNAKAILATPTDFLCFKKNITKIEDVPVVELKWKKPPMNNLVYGQIEYYKLTIRFVNFPAYEVITYTIAASQNTVETFLSQINGYRDGGKIIYTIALCNNNGCSTQNASCSIQIINHLMTNMEKPSGLSIILACVIPSISMLVLVVGGFLSYYRKKEIENDLSDSHMSWANGKLNYGASVSSQNSSTIDNQSSKRHNLSESSTTSDNEIISEKSSSTDKFVNDNVLSVNREDIARLFIQTFSPSSRQKSKTEALLKD